MYVNNLTPEIFSIGNFSVSFYGLVYSIGFLIALLFLLHVARKDEIKNLDEDKVYDLMIYLILGSIFTARLFYVLFYNFGFYAENPLQIFAFWNGGMAFHGGFIGAIGAIYYFTKKNNISFLQIADAIIIPTVLMLGFGRIANFVNSELVGTVTNVSWCVYFNGEDTCRHPSQLYESIKNFFTFGVLFGLRHFKSKFNYPDGTLFFLFITMYGFLRFFVTFFRVPDVIILGIGQGQWLSLLMGIFGLILLIRNYKKG